MRPGIANVLQCDLYRYEGARGVWGFLKTYLREPGFKFTVWFRLASFLEGNPWLILPRWFAKFRRHRLEIRYGISIPSGTLIGPGLYIGHFGGIVVNREATIGSNCNLSHDVTIGQSNRGPRAGCPVIEDRVFLGPGCRVIGKITIQSDAAVGANSVVTRDVPAFSVVAGMPARPISREGSRQYVQWMLQADNITQ